MKLLTKDQILNVTDISFEVVDVPQWGGSVRLKGLTAAEYDQYQQGLFEGDGDKRKINMTNARARMLALAIVDDSGAAIFTEEDVAALGKKASSPIEMLYRKALKLNGDDADSESIEKNSKATTSNDSTLS